MGQLDLDMDVYKKLTRAYIGSRLPCVYDDIHATSQRCANKSCLPNKPGIG